MTQDNQKAPLGSFAKYAMRAVAHGLGVSVVAVLLLVPYLNRWTLEAMWWSTQFEDFIALTWVDALLHLGLAACLWTLVVLGFEIVTSRRKPLQKTFRLQNGSVMTETLVILPIFLLLTFGIGQLAINNIAGLVANTAVFQAGRTAWLWSSEAEVGRRGVNSSLVQEMARIQAAAVLTPVAPGEFTQNLGGTSEQFKQMRGIFVGGQLPNPSQDAGQPAMGAANTLMAGNNLTNISEKNSTFNRAFDTSGFRQRTARKFTFAYHATTVEIIDRGDEVGARLIYRHHQAFPMVGGIFGDADADVGGRLGYYATLEREFTMPKQILPNATTP